MPTRITEPARSPGSSLVVLVALFVAIALTAFVLGLSGLLVISGRVTPHLRVWDIALGIVHIYSGQRPEWQEPGVPLPLRYQIAEVLGPVSTGYALVSTAAAVLVKQIRLLRARLARHQSIVCGGERAGVALARALAGASTAVLVDLEASSDRTVASLGRGVIPMSGDPRDEIVLRRAGVQRAKELFAVADADDVNASIAIAARGASGGRKSKLKCYALVGDRDLHLTLQARVVASNVSSMLDLHLIDRHQLYASALINQEAPDPDGVTVLVGYGEMAYALGMELVRYHSDQHPRKTTRPRLVLIGPESKGLLSALGARWEGLDQVVEIQAFSDLTEIGIHQLRSAAASVTALVSEGSEDRRTLHSGLAWLNDPTAAVDRVVLVMEAETGLTAAFSPSGEEVFAGRASLLRVYSRALPLLDPDHIRAQSFTERMARRLHLVYLRDISDGTGSSSPGAQAGWSALPETLRDSNRDQAREIGRKLAAVGLTVVPVGRRSRPALGLTEGQVDSLARLEHERWMTERQRAGYTYGPERSQNHHPDLVPWEKLGEPAREKDRIFIRRLPALLLAEGYETVIDPTLPRQAGKRAS